MTALPRYYAKRFALESYWPTLWMERGKHATSYYYLRDVEALYRASLLILKQRVKDGYIREPAKEPWRLEPDVTDEVLAALEGKLHAEALAIRGRNLASRTQHQEEVQVWWDTQRCLKEEDGVGAFLILQLRDKYEYEQLSFQNVVTP